MGSYGSDGKVDFEKLKTNLANVGTVKNPEATTFPIEVTVDGQDFLVDGNGAVNKLIETANDETKPYLPTGATVLESDLDKGLTIKDANDNEWVWIEVPKSIYTDVTYTVANNNTNVTSSTDYTGIYNILNKYAETYREGKSGQGAYWTDEWYDYCGTTYDGTNEYPQVKYITLSTYFDEAKAYYGKIYEDNTGTTEAEEYVSGTTYYAKITDKLTDTSGCGLTYSEYTKNYQKMLSSVYTNGGFYIGRYEAGISDTTPRTASGDITEVAKSQKDMYPYNYVTCSQSQILASKMTPDSRKTSSLMFGIQWDLVCKFLEVKSDLEVADINSDSGSWGNYCNETFPVASGKYAIFSMSPFGLGDWNTIPENYEKPDTGTERIVLLSTGATERNSKMNIYDLAGNEFEWTLEHDTPGSNLPCAHRGGNYHSISYGRPASSRYVNTTTSADYDDCFRPALY